ncbi:MAG: hypothetical protein AB1486_29860 [Planctomycetota bacterium]
MGLAKFQKLIDTSPRVARWVRRSRLFGAMQQRKLRRWEAAGRPVPVPNIVKQRAVLDYGRRFGLRVLVETGTFYGAMLLAARPHFERLYSIELDNYLHQRARRLFAGDSGVHLAHGDSGKQLAGVLAELTQPALFWLDAHYSGAGTARGPLDTPIVAELLAIFRHPITGHVILIDDARDFGRLPDYPPIDDLRRMVAQHKPGHTCEVRDDIIRIHA